MKVPAFGLLLIACVFFNLRDASAQRPDGRSDSRSLVRKLGTLQYDKRARLYRSPRIGPGVGMAAFAVREKRGWRVYLDGRRSRLFRALHTRVVRGPGGTLKSWKGPVFSPDGRRTAYAARIGRWWRLIVDNRVGSARFRNIKTIRFSADGRRIAFVGSVRGGVRVVVDGRRGARHDKIRGFAFSTRGRHFAYIARRGRWEYVVKDHKTVRRVPRVGSLAVGVDGRLAYSTGRAKAWRVHVGGAKSPVMPGLLKEQFFFGPAGKRFVYAASRQPGSCFYVVAGKEYAVNAHCRYFSFAPDGKQWGYAGGDLYRGPAFVVVNGKAEAKYDSVSIPLLNNTSPVLFRRGRRAYIAVSRGKQHLVIGELEQKSTVGPAYDVIFTGVAGAFSDNGASFAFMARKGAKMLVARNRLPDPEYDEVFGLVQSRDGKQWAYGARKNGGYYVVRNGKEKPVAARPFAFAFSPSGRVLVWSVLMKGRTSLWINGVAELERDYVFARYVWRGDRLIYFARDKGGLFKIETKAE